MQECQIMNLSLFFAVFCKIHFSDKGFLKVFLYYWIFNHTLWRSLLSNINIMYSTYKHFLRLYVILIIHIKQVTVSCDLIRQSCYGNVLFIFSNMRWDSIPLQRLLVQSKITCVIKILNIFPFTCSHSTSLLKISISKYFLIYHIYIFKSTFYIFFLYSGATYIQSVFYWVFFCVFLRHIRVSVPPTVNKTKCTVIKGVCALTIYCILLISIYFPLI